MQRHGGIFQRIVLNKKSQSQKVIDYVIPFIWYSWDDKSIEIDKRLVVVWGKGTDAAGRRGCDYTKATT